MEIHNEVKDSDVEILNVGDDQDTDDTDADEQIIPPVNDDDAIADSEVPPRAPSTDTTPEIPASSKEQEPLKEVQPVEGETPRESALRKELERVREERRLALQGKIFKDEKAPQQPINTRLEKLRERYSDEEIQGMEEAIDVLAESKGYVKKEHTYQESANTTLDAFINENPEYRPVNDKDDIRWGRFQSLLTDGTYNLSGKTPSQLKHIFEKVHADVRIELGEPDTVTAPRKIAAQQHKAKVASHSGGTASTVQEVKKQVDPSIRSHFKGFDDDDLI